MAGHSISTAFDLACHPYYVAASVPFAGTSLSCASSVVCARHPASDSEIRTDSRSCLRQSCFVSFRPRVTAAYFLERDSFACFLSRCSNYFDAVWSRCVLMAAVHYS